MYEIKLTEQEMISLRSYLSATKENRKADLAVWEDLCKEQNPDGSPRFPNAQGNASFLRERCLHLDAVLNKLYETTPRR